MDVRADTPLLSRKPARLTVNYDHLLLEDLVSSNGTFVNGQPLAAGGSVRLFPGQSLRLGPDIALEVRRVRGPAVTGGSAMEMVDKVRRGEIEWLSGRVGVPPAGCGVSPKRTSESGTTPDPWRKIASQDAPLGGRDAHPTRDRAVPASLLAVVRKAMTLAAAARYRRVEDLQADLLAYQNGFATSAEKAGAWKQATLFVRRHKAVATSIAAALAAVSAVFTLRVVGEKNRAENALADLKKTAPGLRQLAESDLPKLEKLRVSRLGKLLEPLRHHPSLQFLAYDDEPYRPAAEFWAAYDAPQPAGAK